MFLSKETGVPRNAKTLFRVRCLDINDCSNEWIPTEVRGQVQVCCIPTYLYTTNEYILMLIILEETCVCV